MKRVFSPKRKPFTVGALFLLILLNQNCASPSSGSGTANTLQAPVIREPMTIPEPGLALGMFALTEIKSVEYRAPAGGFAKPGLNVDEVGVLATFNGSTLLPIKIYWSIIDFDQRLADCYIFVNPLDVHADFINILLSRLAATSLDRVRMPTGLVMSCLDCKSEPLLTLRMNDTSAHSYLFSHQNLDSSPVTEINDPNGALESTLAHLVTLTSDVVNPDNPNNHCSPP